MTRLLIFDADDTLWDNNVRFDRTFDAYLEWMVDLECSLDQVREVFSATEEANVRDLGYGTAVFVRSLRDTFAAVHGRAATPTEDQRIDTIAADLLVHVVQPMEGVVETLTELRTRNRLWLLTKGVEAEQQAKIDTSGLAPLFERLRIVDEKDPRTYSALVADHGLDPKTTWMIGNSPKSDVNASRAAGLQAVWIPHASTWVLEHEEVDLDDSGIQRVDHIRRLRSMF